MPVTGFRYLVFAAASLATAISVTTVGVIGFIGLVVPHLVRIVSGSDHRIVVPASALAGGGLLVIASHPAWRAHSFQINEITPGNAKESYAIIIFA